MSGIPSSVSGVVEPPLNGPTDLSRPDLKAVVRGTVAEFRADDVPSLAAGVAFKIFLSLFPSLLAAAAIYGLVREPSEIGNLLERLSGVLPGEVIQLIERPVRNLTRTQPRTAGLAIVIGVGGGLLSATGAAGSLVKALNRAYGITESRKFLSLRLLYLAIVLALLAALIGLAALLVFGPQVQDLIVPDRFADSPVKYLFGAGQFLLALVVLALFFAFVYWVGPNRERPTWEWMTPGAALGVVLWLLVSGGFAIYTQTVSSYDPENSSYGALAGVIVALLWLQLSMLAILAGAELNAELESLRQERAREGQQALGTAAARPAPAGMPPPAGPLLAGAPPEPLPDALPEPPALVGAAPTPTATVTTPTATRAGAVAGAGMAVLLFLGLARRTRRRDGAVRGRAAR